MKFLALVLRGRLAHVGQTGPMIGRPTEPAPDGSHLGRVELFGLEFVDAPNVGVVADAVLAFDSDSTQRLPLVVTPNLDHLVQLQDADEAVLEATSSAAFVLPDGQPIVWASRRFDSPLSARLTGSDLFALLWERLDHSHGGVLVIAPSDEVAEGLAERKPTAQVIVAPRLADGDQAERLGFVRDVIASVGQPLPRHVFVCLGQPKQLLVALDLLAAWPEDASRPLCYCVGAAPEMYLGIERRAPEWMQRAGLEFLHRARLNPRRLVKRYARDALQFPRLLAAERRRRREDQS